jgi:hypothetical protein
MPTYDYRCEVNDRVIEVKHGMNESIKTWGALCEHAGIEPGDTPGDTPVVRLISGGHFVSGGSASSDLPACTTGSCGGGFCGLN